MRYRIKTRGRSKHLFPDALFRRQLQYYAVGAVIGVMAIAFAIILRRLSMLLLGLMSAYMVYMGLQLERDWYNGAVKCRELLFLSVEPAELRNRIGLLFLDKDETKCRFFVYGKAQAKFTPGKRYYIYTQKDSPLVLTSQENNT